MKKQSFRFAFYGTLRQGGMLSSHVDFLRRIALDMSTEKLFGLRMFVFGSAPIAIRTYNESDFIVAEVISLSLNKTEYDSVKRYLDRIEGVPLTGYLLDRIPMANGSVCIYTYRNKLPKTGLIEIQDWHEWSRAFRSLNDDAKRKILSKGMSIIKV